MLALGDRSTATFPRLGPEAAERAVVLIDGFDGPAVNVPRGLSRRLLAACHQQGEGEGGESRALASTRAECGRGVAGSPYPRRTQLLPPLGKLPPRLSDTHGAMGGLERLCDSRALPLTRQRAKRGTSQQGVFASCVGFS